MRYWFLIPFLSFSVMASINPTNKSHRVEYKTYFGNCPAKTVGKLTLSLIRKFEESQSLGEVKKMMVEQKLMSKHFIKSYDISYHPLMHQLKFQFQCHKALMKAQVYKTDGDELYTAILSSTGELLDPTYEVLLRSEGILKEPLPLLAIPVDQLEDGTLEELTLLLGQTNQEFKRELSEIIVNEKKEITVILSINKQPSSIFLGQDYWREKVEKLIKIITYMKEKKTIPVVINLRDIKKVVVKFSGAI